MLSADVTLHLMVHKTPVSPELEAADNVTVVRADLARPETLGPAVRGADVVVHFAGVLFAPRPEKFLAETNTQWFNNLLTACLEEKVGRVVLISFPHVEGPSSVEHPATGRLDREPISVHAQTRLAEEKALMARTEGTATTPVVLRLGMVYGAGILMIEAARWLARHRLLGVWREPTWIQLVSIADFLAATQAAALSPEACGIYHVGDEQPITLQAFLDQACEIWGYGKPWRMPLWLIYAAAAFCEVGAFVLCKPAPLTRDFITIGRVSYWGDTARTRQELVGELVYRCFEDGKHTLVGADQP